MKSNLFVAMLPRASLLSLLAASLVGAQTYTDCNPLETTCSADTALGTSITVDFTDGESDEFTASGSPTYDSTNGVAFTISESGDAPLLSSNWYIMFGKVQIVVKAAPGTGIVSSAVLQSDDLDEIDWEWLGVSSTEVETNYFGKGNTTTYDRAIYEDMSDNQDSFHTYTIDWTSSYIIWYIDGTAVRKLTPSTADTNQYPQTPMQVKLGCWSGGDSNNDEGTIEWAGGETDYSDGPFTMYVKSITVQDYSTGTSYSYSDESGDWDSITSNGGTINSSGDSDASSVTVASSGTTATSNSAPIPFDSSVYPWVARSTSQTSTTPVATITNLPSGWVMTSSGKVRPSTASNQSQLLASTSSLSASQQASSYSSPEKTSTVNAATSNNSQKATTLVTQTTLTGTAVSTEAPSAQVQANSGSATDSRECLDLVMGITCMLVGAFALLV